MKKRLTVENDDRASMFAVSDLLWLHEKVGIPIVFDFHVRDLAVLTETDQPSYILPRFLSSLITKTHIETLCLALRCLDLSL